MVELVVDNTVDNNEDIDKMEGWMKGQATAFENGKAMQEQLETDGKSATYKAACITGFLSYYHELFESLQAQAGLSSEGQTVN